MNKVSFLIGFLLISMAVLSQNQEDALRYSWLNRSGDARFISMGGAFTSLGANFSSTITNPAGIGLYKSSEFSISPSVFIGSTESRYFGDVSDDSRTVFNLGNVGVVVNVPVQDRLGTNPWKSFNFGFGLNRLNDFNNRIMIDGYNPNSSLSDLYEVYADGIYPDQLDPYDTRPAFNTYLIDTIPGQPTEYYPASLGGERQINTITTEGSMNEVVFSAAANYMDRLYLGLTLGLPYLRYSSYSVITERDFDEANTNTDIEEFNVRESLDTRGSGINLHFGAIYKATDWLRLGASVHTPTWLTHMEDEWYSDFESYFYNGDYFRSSSPTGFFDYEINTPWRFSGGMSFIFGKYGLISADYEFVDYSTAKIRSDSYSFIDENKAIESTYKATNNFRFGTEWWFENYGIRGGYAINQSPFSNNLNDGKQNTISVGIGYKERSFSIDLGYSLSKSEEAYYIYQIPDDNNEPAYNDFKRHMVVLTTNFRF